MPSGPRIALVGVLMLSLAISGCADSQVIAPGKLRDLVIRESDLPPGYSGFVDGPQTRLDNQGTARSDPTRYGREGGWIARYRPSDTTVTAGALVVESRADLFKDGAGAKADLAAYRRVFSQAPAGDVQPQTVEGLGDEGLGVTFTQAGTPAVRFYRIAWRFRNATASVTIQGFDGAISLSDAVALARKQQKHLSAA